VAERIHKLASWPPRYEEASVYGFQLSIWTSIWTYRWLEALIFVVNENLKKGQWIEVLVITVHYRWLGKRRQDRVMVAVQETLLQAKEH